MNAEFAGVGRIVLFGGLLLVGADGWVRRLVPSAGRLFRFVAATTVAFAFVILALEALGTFGLIRRANLDVATTIFGVLGWWFGRTSHVNGDEGTDFPPARHRLVRVLDRSATIASAASLAVGALVCYRWFFIGAIAPVAPVSDGPIYHLPIAIRWAVSGSLERVWTPFGELAATYFPANGDLWMTWLFLQTGDDRCARVGQAPFVVLTSMALIGIGLRLGRSPLLPACGFLACGLVQATLSLPLVDLVLCGWLTATAYFLLEAAHRPTNRLPILAFAGLAFGAALGTKSIGVLAIPFAALALASVVRLDWRGWSVFLFAAVLAGGYWFLRSWRETGNPLYPLHVEVAGRRILEGWYDGRIMRETSDYHLDPRSWKNLALVMTPVAHPAVWSLWAGAILFGLLQFRRRPAAAALAAAAFLWFAAMWFVVPYNTQQRFVLPALALGMAPLAGCRGLAAAIPLIAYGWAIAQTGGWGFYYSTFALAVYGALAFCWIVGRRLSTHVSVGLALVATMLLGGVMIEKQRIWQGVPPKESFYPDQGFAVKLRPAWMTLERAATDKPAVVAYAGTNLPYYLYGPAFQRRPVYVNVNATADRLPHDRHRARLAAGRTDLAPTAWPQWHRENPNFDVWLANLRELGVEYLFVARENFHGRKDAPTGLAPFPIEYRWASDRPDLFERLGPHADFDESWGVVYRVRRSAPVASSANP